ncbi:cellulose biosynthesis protein BcsR [Paraburkholderia sp. RAU2J]|uniref:cellulose biosynthesis protein BcsP n=1 Tax=Paraburkholderia sp. RAU2J TaxID=1938810 RepID=UPI000EB26CCD|nr:cellulose biosynthesis protein BcsP [Paraburkholderia sp. RAU2J]RKT21319.1 cellulose biosynthesis protein BcsR [Paraburkholderia sp. RAU2J]
MSSSSDIEKLFDHFGGDANAYQEIGRENEARSARTRWPLLVTLDLTQPTIPAIGQAREARPQAPPSAAATAVDRQDATPKDVAAVTRAKAPLFTRSHRRDIPPVVVAAAQPAAPSGASRFGALEAEDEGTARDASAGGRLGEAQHAASASSAPAAAATAASPVATPAGLASLAAVSHTALATPVGGGSPAFLLRTPATQTPSAASTWAQAPAPAFAPMQQFATAPAPAFAGTYAPATPAAQPTPPASILGKLFAAPRQPAPPQAAAPANESAPLQSVFDRLRGAPAPTPAMPAGASRAAAPGVANSWLVNGPRRS